MIMLTVAFSFYASRMFVLGAAVSMPGFGQDTYDIKTWLTEASSVKATEARKAITEFGRELKDLNMEYANAFDERRAILTERLDAARLEATKSDQLDTAVQIRELQKSLGDISARPKDAVAESSARQSMKRRLAELVGNWSGKWGTTGNTCLVPIDECQNVKVDNERRTLSLQNGRLILQGSSALHQHVEIVPYADRMILLGWTVGRKLNPLNDQPDHVAMHIKTDGRAKP